MTSNILLTDARYSELSQTWSHWTWLNDKIILAKCTYSENTVSPRMYLTVDDHMVMTTEGKETPSQIWAEMSQALLDWNIICHPLMEDSLCFPLPHNTHT